VLVASGLHPRAQRIALAFVLGERDDVISACLLCGPRCLVPRAIVDDNDLCHS